MIAARRLGSSLSAAAYAIGIVSVPQRAESDFSPAGPNPKMRVQIGSLSLSTSTALLASKRMYEPSWRETSFFTEREQAALAFTEDVTMMAGEHVPAAAYEAVAAHWAPGEIAALLALIVTINAWNAIGVTTRAWEPGSYQP